MSPTRRTPCAATVPDSVPSTEGMTRLGVRGAIGAHEIVATLGRSETTEVLLAVTRGPHGFVRPVVLKRPSAARWGERVTHALAREALAYARVCHPAIVQLYEFFEHDGAPVLVLEYVSGLSLGRLRGLVGRQGRDIGDDVAMYVMCNVFGALAALHAARDPLTGEHLPVVHRDVTPGNVLLGWDGTTKLTDLGIARLAGVESDSRVGLLKGTYGYMAPEQVTGDPVTSRTDVYAACLLLRELLLGQRTYSRDLPELELLQAMANPRLLPVEELRAGVPRPLCDALRAGLEPDPARRTIAASEVRDVLLEVAPMALARDRLRGLLSELRPMDEHVTAEQSVTTNPLAIGTLVDLALASLPGIEVPDRSSPGVITTERLLPCQPSAATPVSGPRPSAPPAPRSPSPSAARPRRPILLAIAAGTLVTLAAVLALRLHGARVLPPVFPVATGFPRASGPPLVVVAASGGATVAPRVESPGLSSTSFTQAVSPQASPPRIPDDAFGDIAPQATRWSHRIYVDGRLQGASGATVRVRCGSHTARFGSKGRLQRIDVPCGGSVELRPVW
jgi:serine/threonine protein kinase